MTDEERIDALHTAAEGHLAELGVLKDRYGSDRSTWPKGYAERAERLETAVRRGMAEADDLVTRAERIAAIKEAAKDPRNLEPAVPVREQPRNRANPWAGMDEDLLRRESASGLVARAGDAIEFAPGLVTGYRNTLQEMVDREGGMAAAAVITLSADAYRSAFGKILRDPEKAHWLLTPEERDAVAAVEVVRAAMNTGTGSAGYLVPLSLNADAVIANAGTANPFRQIGTVVTTASSPYRLTSTAGITGEWLGEGVQASDVSPTFAKTDVTLFKGAAFAFGSVEVLQDTNAAELLPRLFADARNTLESTAYAVGNGATAPLGIVTQAIASSASTKVDPSTGGVFTVSSISDVFRCWDSLPPRARQSRSVAWIANNAVWSLVRRMDLGSGSFWQAGGGLASGLPETLLGAPAYEASAMDSSMTTGAEPLLVGDFSKFVIADHVMGYTVEYINTMVSGGGAAYPTGQKGWFAYARTGSSASDITQFRYLQL